MSVQWEDVTSYSRGERGKVEPREWLAFSDAVSLSVHRVLYCDGWFWTCYMLDVHRAPLKESTAAKAKREAALELMERLNALTRGAKKILEATP